MITVTTEARDKLQSIIDADALVGSAVRLSVVRGPHGCVHGWDLGFDDDLRPDDAVFTFGSIEVRVEPELVDALAGAKIDYRESGSSLGFSIDVPGTRTRGGGCGNH
ncbi:iron-sulfur cluster insertion protein ErpA [bacterium BMS3Bbin02]|nr:iron-sulfur cluster insertion protein ErpA [bacterium BMS3Bbin02]